MLELQDLREDLKDDGRFFLGSCKVMRVALGKETEDEYKDNLHR